jgi:hypothetical protein
MKKVKWDEEMIYKLALMGATVRQVADFLGLTTRAVELWVQHRKEGFIEAWNRGKIEADMNVAGALYRKAIGYEYEERVTIKGKDGNMLREEITTKQQAPDAFACLKWLQVRQRESWTAVDKTEVNVNYGGKVDMQIITEQLKDDKQYSTDELKLALKMGLTEIAEHAKN